MKNIKKRILALWLSVCMALTMMPSMALPVFAAETTVIENLEVGDALIVEGTGGGTQGGEKEYFAEFHHDADLTNKTVTFTIAEKDEVTWINNADNSEGIDSGTRIEYSNQSISINPVNFTHPLFLKVGKEEGYKYYKLSAAKTYTVNLAGTGVKWYPDENCVQEAIKSIELQATDSKGKTVYIKAEDGYRALSDTPTVTGAEGSSGKVSTDPVTQQSEGVYKVTIKSSGLDNDDVALSVAATKKSGEAKITQLTVGGDSNKATPAPTEGTGKINEREQLAVEVPYETSLDSVNVKATVSAGVTGVNYVTEAPEDSFSGSALGSSDNWSGTVNLSEKKLYLEVVAEDGTKAYYELTVSVAAPTVELSDDNSNLKVGSAAKDVKIKIDSPSGLNFKEGITSNTGWFTLSGAAAGELTVQNVTRSDPTKATVTLSDAPAIAGDLVVTVNKEAFETTASDDAEVTVNVAEKEKTHDPTVETAQTETTGTTSDNTNVGAITLETTYSTATAQVYDTKDGTDESDIATAKVAGNQLTITFSQPITRTATVYIGITETGKDPSAGRLKVTINPSEIEAKIGEIGYATIDAALKDADDGDTVILEKSFDDAESLTLPAGVSIQKNGEGQDTFTGNEETLIKITSKDGIALSGGTAIFTKGSSGDGKVKVGGSDGKEITVNKSALISGTEKTVILKDKESFKLEKVTVTAPDDSAAGILALALDISEFDHEYDLDDVYKSGDVGTTYKSEDTTPMVIDSKSYTPAAESILTKAVSNQFEVTEGAFALPVDGALYTNGVKISGENVKVEPAGVVSIQDESKTAIKIGDSDVEYINGDASPESTELKLKVAEDGRVSVTAGTAKLTEGAELEVSGKTVSGKDVTVNASKEVTVPQQENAAVKINGTTYTNEDGKATALQLTVEEDSIELKSGTVGIPNDAAIKANGHTYSAVGGATLKFGASEPELTDGTVELGAGGGTVKTLNKNASANVYVKGSEGVQITAGSESANASVKLAEGVAEGTIGTGASSADTNNALISDTEIHTIGEDDQKVADSIEALEDDATEQIGSGSYYVKNSDSGNTGEVYVKKGEDATATVVVEPQGKFTFGSNGTDYNNVGTYENDGAGNATLTVDGTGKVTLTDGSIKVTKGGADSGTLYVGENKIGNADNSAAVTATVKDDGADIEAVDSKKVTINDKEYTVGTSTKLHVDDKKQVTVSAGEVTLGTTASVYVGGKEIAGENAKVGAPAETGETTVTVPQGNSNKVSIDSKEYSNLEEGTPLKLKVSSEGAVTLESGKVKLPAAEGAINTKNDYEVSGNGITVDGTGSDPKVSLQTGESVTLKHQDRTETYEPAASSTAEIELGSGGPVLTDGKVDLKPGQSIGAKNGSAEAKIQNTGEDTVTVEKNKVTIKAGQKAVINGVEFAAGEEALEVSVDTNGNAIVTLGEGKSATIGGVEYSDIDDGDGAVTVNPEGKVTVEGVNITLNLPANNVDLPANQQVTLGATKNKLSAGTNGASVSIDASGNVKLNSGEISVDSTAAEAPITVTSDGVTFKGQTKDAKYTVTAPVGGVGNSKLAIDSGENGKVDMTFPVDEKTVQVGDKTIKGSKNAEVSVENISGTHTVGAKDSNTTTGGDGSTFTGPYTPPSSGGTPGASSTTVTTSTAANGKVGVDKTDAKAGDTVTVTANPDEGYEVGSVVVTDKNGKNVTVTENADGTYSFVMPEADAQPVKVDVTFKKKDEGGEVTPPTADPLVFSSKAQERDIANRLTTSKDTSLKLKAADEDVKIGKLAEWDVTSDNPDVVRVLQPSHKLRYMGVGTANITVKATGSNDKVYSIVIPIKVKLGTPTFTLSHYSSKKARTFTVTTSTVRGADGFQVRYSLKKSLKSSKTKTYECGKKLNRKTIKANKSRRTYYVRVRAYIIDEDGNIKTGAWSKLTKTIRSR